MNNEKYNNWKKNLKNKFSPSISFSKNVMVEVRSYEENKAGLRIIITLKKIVISLLFNWRLVLGLIASSLISLFRLSYIISNLIIP